MANNKENKAESVKASAPVVEAPAVVETPVVEETPTVVETPVVEETPTVVETKKVRFLLSPCGAFLLPYNVGQEVDLPVNQADELVEAKYAEYVQ